LGSANAKPADAGGKKMVEMELPDAGKTDEANSQYLAALNVLKEGPQKEKEATVSAAVAKEDDFKKFRTLMTLAWVMSNLALCAVLTQPVIQSSMDIAFNGPLPTDWDADTPPRINPYLAFLFWATAFFAVIKFIGCIWYLMFQQVLDFKRSSGNVNNAMAKRPGFNA
jgi:chitin synthase